MANNALKFKGARSKSRTQQHFKDEVNVNTIMKKARRSGVLPFKGPEDCIFQDLTTVTDYKEAQDRIIAINNKFNELPANIRSKFGNAPEKILEYLQDPKNEEEARQLGLLRPLTEQELEAKQASQPAAPAPEQPAP